MATVKELISLAKHDDFDAADELASRGPEIIADLMQAAASEVFPSGALREVMRRVQTTGQEKLLEPFVSTHLSPAAFKVAVNALARAGRDGAEVVKRFAGNDDQSETYRGIALTAIGHTHDVGHTTFIHGVIDTPSAADGMLKVAAIEALTMLGDHSRDTDIEHLLASRKVEVKLAAAKLFPNLFYRDLLGLLKSACKHRLAEVRRHAIDALSYIGTRRFADAILPALQDPDAITRQHALAGVAAVTGVDADDIASDGAAEAIFQLTDDICHRDGKPIDLIEFPEKAEHPPSRSAIVEELRIITGVDFGYSADRPDGDQAVVDRIRAWTESNVHLFEKGAVHKFGFRQNLSTLRV